MPYGDYNPKHIMKRVQTRHKKGETIRHVVQKHEMQMEKTKLELDVTKAHLKKHEDREKRRMDGLKKAQKARKGNSNGGKRK